MLTCVESRSPAGDQAERDRLTGREGPERQRGLTARGETVAAFDGDASSGAALLLHQIWQLYVVAPCPRGASPVSVQRHSFTTDCKPRRSVALRDRGDPSGGGTTHEPGRAIGAGIRGPTLVSTGDRGFSRSRRLDRPEVVIISQVFPGQDGSPREAGLRSAVLSEADPLSMLAGLRRSLAVNYPAYTPATHGGEGMPRLTFAAGLWWGSPLFGIDAPSPLVRSSRLCPTRFGCTSSTPACCRSRTRCRSLV